MIRFFIVLSMAQIAVAQTCANVINGHVDIPENAFKDCTSLKSITIPDSVKVVGHEAFEDCTDLASVNIGDGVQYIGWGPS